MSEDLKYLEAAYDEALKALNKDEVPIGCVIVCNGVIVGRGHNKRIEENNALYHAEIVAIEEACKKLKNWRLDNCSIYITVEPCVMCAGAIMEARIKKVVFGVTDPKRGAVVSKLKLFDNRDLPFKIDYKLISYEKAGIILKKFFHSKRRKSEK